LTLTNWHVRADVLDAVAAHARDSRPAECCGMLLGRSQEIVAAVRAGNLDADPNRFLIDPADHFDALRQARALGLDVVGFYHSHPRTPAAPSPTDLAEASYRHHVYMIVSLQTEPPGFALYWLGDQAFQRVELIAVP
jgi:proteasome lid subunit RPN8/RPN11